MLDYVRGTRADPYRPYKIMLAVDAAMVAGTLATHALRNAYHEHSLLLVSYEFGFMKRALIGELMSYGFPKISLLHVYALGVATWLSVLVAFLLLFKRCFGFRRETLPLLAFILGSPFFFKNFMLAVGHFDLFGCLAAILAILLPVTLFYPLILGIAAVLLLLVHHIHFLLYLPTIAVIAVLRWRHRRAITPAQVALWGAIALVVVAAFVKLAYFSSAPVSREVLLDAMRARALGPVEPRPDIWFATIADELRKTWQMLPVNIYGFPLYVLLALLHLPLIRFGANLIRNLADDIDRMLVWLGLAAVSAAFIVIFVVVYDYSRWVSNWAVCMMLIMHTVTLLPAREAPAEPPLAPAAPGNVACAWALTLIPRVGIVMPFH
ncbi:MAG TPA: hypothetical protein VHG27_03090 [Xanthobacteraceae bacterium]|nr:hypothetical protein [Xanthobacteraceae bacterium]